MAKIKGPLFSEGAAGNFAKGAMQFRGGLRGTHAYRPKSPKAVNQAPPTPAQETVRSAYQEILTQWRALSELEKMSWDTQAGEAGMQITGWNLFFKTQMLGGLAPETALITDSGEFMVTDLGEYIVYG